MWRAVEETAQDLRYARRMLAKSPGFTSVAVLTLALGIGANTAVFSIVNAVLLRALPYKDPQRLVAVWDRSVGETGLAKIFDSYRDFEEWSRHARSFEQLAACTWAVRGQVLIGRGPARPILAIPVSESFFSMLGIAPERGRTFANEDVKRGCSVVLSDRFWRSRLGGQQDIAGKNITLDQRECNVLGIMPPAFAFYPRAADLWTLLTPNFTPPLDDLQVGVFGRLKPGVTQAQAQAELTALHTSLHQMDGRERGITPTVYNLQDEFTFLAGRNLRTTLWLLLAAVCLVLLIACLNLAILLIGRSFARQRELAVRAALGSGSARLIRQVLTEGLLLSLIGGAAGILAAFGAIRYFRASHPIELPIGADVRISIPVLVFTAVISIVTALLFGFVPAYKASRLDMIASLKSGGRGAALSGMHRGLAQALLIAQMAFSVILLVCAGLLMGSVVRMGSAPLGFQPDHLLVTGMNLPADRYSDARRRIQFYEKVALKLGSLPGILGVALASGLPPYGGPVESLQIQGAPMPSGGDIHDVGQRAVSPEYFRVLGVPLLRGRVFDHRDQPESEAVAIVNQALVHKYFPHDDPLGQVIRLGEKNRATPWMTIMGVVAGEKHPTLYQEMSLIETPAIFRPITQDPSKSVSIAVRTIAGQAAIGGEIQRAIAAIDSSVPVNEIEMMQERLALLLAYPRFRAALLAVFAGFALLLAAIGLHGVLQQFVAQRTQEIGVRMAIGARRADIARLVAKQGGLPVIAGLALGLTCATALGRYLSSLLYDVAPGDPATLMTVSLALMITAAIAIAIPARRAVQVDPMVALRHE